MTGKWEQSKKSLNNGTSVPLRHHEIYTALNGAQ